MFNPNMPITPFSVKNLLGMEYMPASYQSHVNSCIPTSIHSFAKTEETVTSASHSHPLPEHNFNMYAVESSQTSFMSHDTEGSAKSLDSERDQDAGKAFHWREGQQLRYPSPALSHQVSH